MSESTIPKGVIKACINQYDALLDGDHSIFDEEEAIDTLMQKLRVLVDGIDPTEYDYREVPSIDLTLSMIFKYLHGNEKRIKALEEKTP